MRIYLRDARLISEIGRFEVGLERKLVRSWLGWDLEGNYRELSCYRFYFEDSGKIYFAAQKIMLFCAFEFVLGNASEDRGDVTTWRAVGMLSTGPRSDVMLIFPEVALTLSTHKSSRGTVAALKIQRCNHIL